MQIQQSKLRQLGAEFFLFDKQSFLALASEKISRPSVRPVMKVVVSPKRNLLTKSKTGHRTENNENGVALFVRASFDKSSAVAPLCQRDGRRLTLRAGMHPQQGHSCIATFPVVLYSARERERARVAPHGMPYEGAHVSNPRRMIREAFTAYSTQ